jgi:ribonuclease HI
MTQAVWALSEETMVEKLTTNRETNARQWMFDLMESLPHDQFTRVAVTLWAIWTARRKAIHEDIFQSPLSTFGFINSFLSELQSLAKPSPHVVKPRVQAQGQTRLRRTQAWIPPPSGMAKINVDAAISRAGDKGAAGAICRDSNGNYLGSSVLIIKGFTDPASLEAIACREALALAEDLALQRVYIASDCKNVVEVLREGTMGKYSSITREIAARSSSLQDCIFAHEGRSSNYEAHNLAKYSVSLDVGRQLWLDVPNFDSIPVNILINQ